MKYKLISENHKDTFDNLLQWHYEEGWRLQGDIQVTSVAEPPSSNLSALIIINRYTVLMCRAAETVDDEY